MRILKRRAFWLIAALLVLSAVFWPKTTPVVAPGLNDSSPSRPLIPDNRVARIDRYFAERGMSLAGYGAKFVEMADQCDMDWRLLPAIAVRESSGGKQACGNNPFGWASCRADFVSINEAIEIVGANLCGFDPRTVSYYKNRATHERLRSYNGVANQNYPDEVLRIMDDF